MSEILEVNGTELLQQSVTSIELLEPAAAVSQLLEIGIQGPPGPRGPAGQAGGSTVSKTAGENLGGNRLTRLNASEQAVYASADQITHAGFVFGMTLGAATSGADVDLMRSGELEEVSWNWTPGLPVYLGLNGVPTQTLPPEAVFSLVIGFPITPTKLVISIREPIILS